MMNTRTTTATEGMPTAVVLYLWNTELLYDVSECRHHLSIRGAVKRLPVQVGGAVCSQLPQTLLLLLLKFFPLTHVTNHTAEEISEVVGVVPGLLRCGGLVVTISNHVAQQTQTHFVEQLVPLKVTKPLIVDGSIND